MRYGSPFYILMLLLLLGTAAVGFFLLRKRSLRVKRLTVLSLMLLNLFQHLFKWAIYPMYRGGGFDVLSTAYNVCALLIILSPVAALVKSRFLKNVIFPVGSVAGIIAIAVPYWYIGLPVSELGWEYARFYICHALLFLSSVLTLALGLHKPSYKECWQTGLGFLLGLGVILLNNVIAISVGIFHGYSYENLYEALKTINTCFMMGPPDNFAWIGDVVAVFSPSFLMGNNSTGLYAPILWYAIPLYIGITVIAAAVFIGLDYPAFRDFIRAVRERISKHKKEEK